jgi:carboxylesterase type B
LQLPGGPEEFLKAVMVWIHGGGFTMGDGNFWMYGPDYLVAEGVVLVTMNYRLGPLGNHNTIPTNYIHKSRVILSL